MKTVEISGLPKIAFAHAFETQSYRARFARDTEFMEILYLDAGQIACEKNGETEIAQTGDVVCILRDVPIEISAQQFHRHHTVGIKVPWHFTQEESGMYLPAVLKASDQTHKITELIDDCIFRRFVWENSPVRAAKLVLNILCNIDEQYRNSLTSTEPSLLSERAKSYIHRNIRKTMTQTEIAQYLGVSSGYLCQVFKKHEGTTIMRYINSAKLKQIYMLMAREGLKLYEAATLFGYSDPNYVSSLYRKLFGYNITDSTGHIEPDFN